MGRPTKRRWFQYTLRTALLLATAFCVALGWWANRAHQQRLAVQQIRSLSGWAEYDRRPDEMRVPKWLRSLVGDDFFVSVNQVTLTHREDGQREKALTVDELDQLVAAMERLPKLKRLSLSHTGLRDEDLSRLAPLRKRIEYIEISSYTKEINGRCISHFRDWPRLKSLYFYCSYLDTYSLDQLSALPCLENLRWTNCKLDAIAFAAMARCKNLQVLSLSRCSYYGDAFLMLTAAPRLNTLWLHNIGGERDRATLGWEKKSESAQYRFYPTSMVSNESHELRNRRAPVDPSEWVREFLPGLEVGSSYSSK